MNAFAGMFASFAILFAADAAAQERLLPELAPAHAVAWFGDSAASHGAELVVGAPAGVGFAMVYRRSDAGWTPVQRLTPDVLRAYGYRVAIGSGWIAVAGRDLDALGWPTSIDLYRSTPSGWQFTQRVASPWPGLDGYVWSMAVTTDSLVVGLVRSDAEGGVIGRSVFVYDRSAGTNVWQTPQELVEPACPFAHAGYALDASDSVLVITDPRARPAGANGGACSFVRDAGHWRFRRLTSSPQPAQTHSYGNAVAVCGDTVAVSTVASGTAPEPDGYVSAFHVNDLPEPVLEAAPITPPPGTANARFFGTRLACDGNVVAIGGTESRRVFTATVHGARSVQEVQITDATMHLPRSLAVAGGDVLVGDPGSPFTSPAPPGNIGVVYVFRGAGETLFAHGFE